MLRWLFTLFSALSLLAFAATVFVWTRSYYNPDCVTVVYADGGGHRFATADGWMAVIRSVPVPDDPLITKLSIERRDGNRFWMPGRSDGRMTDETDLGPI